MARAARPSQRAYLQAQVAGHRGAAASRRWGSGGALPQTPGQKYRLIYLSVQVALKMPNNIIRYQIFDGVTAQVNQRGVLQISTVYSKQLVGEFPPESFIAWRYVAPPPPATATSRSGVLLKNHGV